MPRGPRAPRCWRRRPARRSYPAPPCRRRSGTADCRRRRPAGAARPSGRARNWPGRRQRQWRRPIVSPATPCARSPARSTMLRPGAAATCSTKARDVSDRSSSTTTTPNPRITGWLNTRLQHDEGEQRHAEDQDDRHAIVQQPSPFASGDEPEPGLRRAASSALLASPVGAHAGPQLRHLLDGVGADRERPQVESRRWRGWRASSHIRPWCRSA